MELMGKLCSFASSQARFSDSALLLDVDGVRALITS